MKLWCGWFLRKQCFHGECWGVLSLCCRSSVGFTHNPPPWSTDTISHFQFLPTILICCWSIGMLYIHSQNLKDAPDKQASWFFCDFFMMSVCTINTTEHKYNTLTYKLDNIDKETIIKALYYYYFFSLAWINDINPYIILGVSIILSKPCINIVKAGSYYKPVYFSLDTNA